MGFRVVDVRGPEPCGTRLDEVARHLLEGGLVAMPTETVYGFGCALQAGALSTLQRLKDRGPEKPFLILISGMGEVPELLWTPEARSFAEVFWPGALTLVLQDPHRRFPAGIRSARGGVAVRVSPDPVASALLEAVGEPLVSTSVNQAGRTPARTADEAGVVAEALGAGPELWILDGGPLEDSEPSTIIDCTGPVPRLRRAGAIPSYRLRCVLPEFDDGIGEVVNDE